MRLNFDILHFSNYQRLETQYIGLVQGLGVDADYEIIPYEKDKFYLKTEEEQIEFIKEREKITGMVLRSKRQVVKSKRMQ